MEEESLSNQESFCTTTIGELIYCHDSRLAQKQW